MRKKEKRSADKKSEAENTKNAPELQNFKKIKREGVFHSQIFQLYLTFYYFYSTWNKMANNRQPLEGLTVRIWDPPAPSINNDKNTKNSQGGSRGFRQYTEQVGK